MLIKAADKMAVTREIILSRAHPTLQTAAENRNLVMLLKSQKYLFLNELNLNKLLSKVLKLTYICYQIALRSV